jgi:methionyl-tRNA formyltransferase
MNKNTWAFFGTSKFSVLVLEKLKQNGTLPTLVVTVMDKPKGRKLILTPPEAKVWAEKEKIPYIQLKTLKDDNVVDKIKSYAPKPYDFFVVASYGKIIPQSVLDIPKLGTLNVHPSLLPKLRGASPIKGAILSENETGVTIMRLDADMDHGPIVAQKKVLSWNNSDMPYAEDLENILGSEGGKMLANILPEWISGNVEEKEQDHSAATLCGKIEKENGQLNMDDSPEINLRKIRAYHIWPGAYYFIENRDKKIRVIVKRAHIEDDKLILERVVPEGKKEMNYKDFLNGQKTN